MTCKISELRKQLESMQSLLDIHKHCHVDSVTPKEKITESVKAKCIEAIRKLEVIDTDGDNWNNALDNAIEAITDVE